MTLKLEATGEFSIAFGYEAVAINTCSGNCSGGLKRIGGNSDPMSGLIIGCEVCNPEEKPL